MEEQRIPEVPDYISEEQWLMERAISLFKEGDDAEAATLFGQVVSIDGEAVEEARRYLELIEERMDELFTEAETLVRRHNELHAARRCFEVVSEISSRRRKDAQAALIGIKKLLAEKEIPRFGPFATGGAETRPSSQTLIKRTPHIDIYPPLPITPGSTIDLTVYADESAARDGEKHQDIVLETSAEVKLIMIEVHLLVTPHYIIKRESNVDILTIHTHEARSSSARFVLQVRSTEDLREMNLMDQPSGITALFCHRGRPCGSVSLNTQIRVNKEEPELATQRT